MSKFTPGPWNCMRNSSAGRNIVCAENQPLDICVLSNRDKTNSEIDANALLIADAPALLRALADLLALAERWEESLDSHYNARSIEEIEADGDLADEITKARALIAKHGGGV